MKDISQFRNQIQSVLKKEIGGRDCCLLDLPNYYNPGDQLIWKGEEQLLKDLGIHIRYRSSIHFFNPKKVLGSDCIILNGGGNFGDLYYKHQKFREKILEKFPNNKIIIMPQTIHFSDKRHLEKSIKKFSKHSNLVIFARDINSLEIIKNKFKNNKRYLLPDAAYSIKDIKKNKINTENRVLFLYRTDKEKNTHLNKNSLNFIRNLDVSDWSTDRIRIIILFFHLLFLYLNRLLLSIYRLFGTHWKETNDIHGMFKFNPRIQQVQNAVKLLSKYDLIITTRLHGLILAHLLGIPTIIINNSYGKNKNFYETWIHQDFFHVYYADSLKDIKEILIKNFPTFLNSYGG